MTSASRTRPSVSASQPSSSRSSRDQSAATSGANVRNDGGGDRAPHDVGRGRLAAQLGDHDLGLLQRSEAEGTHDLGRRVGRAGAVVAEPPDELLDEPGRCVLRSLDLELAEARTDAPAVEHGDFVVDEVRQQTAVPVSDVDPAPHRAQAYLRRQVGGADVRANEVDGRLGGPSRVPREGQLGPHEQVAAPLSGKLERPALTAAVAEADPPAREPEVIGVEVDGLEPLGLARNRIEAVGDIGEARKPKRRRCGELHLALLVGRHGSPLARCSASSCRRS